MYTAVSPSFFAFCGLLRQTPTPNISDGLHHHVDKTVVTMRELTSEQIAAYLRREPDAIYCAGAAKSESLGAALLEKVETCDPNALIGLPIFRLIDFLQAEGVDIL